MIIEEEDEEEDLDDMFAVAATEKKRIKKIKRVLVRERFCPLTTLFTDPPPRNPLFLPSSRPRWTLLRIQKAITR